MTTTKRPTLAQLQLQRDSDGWWAYTPSGWHNSGEPSHTFHEDTKAELLQAIRDFLEPCDCHECQSDLAAKVAQTKTPGA